MKINYGFKANFGNSSVRQGSSNVKVLSLGRVEDIILDSSHPKYKELGESQSLYGVFYSTFGENITELSTLGFAYCNQQGFKRIPVKNEVVKLEFLVSAEGEGVGKGTSSLFWTEIVSTWNHPHHNVAPNPDLLARKGLDLGTFEERVDINPLRLYLGDVAIEGRYGQSIRLGGKKLESDTLKTGDSGTYVIIRNGQGIRKDTPYDTVGEDINEDPNSIYLLTNHKVGLREPVKIKRDSWNKVPEEYSRYLGNQVILNADRLILNAKKEHTLISAKQGIGLMSSDIALDAHTQVGIDAKKIYLGKKSQEELEPVLLGNSTTEWLRDLVGTLGLLIETMGSTPSTPDSWVPVVATMAKSLDPIKKTLEQRLRSLESKKIFVE